MKTKKPRGNDQGEPRSIVFSGPIRDALGREVRELTEDNATWELTVLPIKVQVPQQRDPMLIGGAQQQLETAAYVPVYKVTQVIQGGLAVAFVVPVEHVRCVRQPLVVCTFTDDDGKESPPQLVPRRAAAQMEAQEAAEIARKALEDAQAPAEPAEHDTSAPS